MKRSFLTLAGLLILVACASPAPAAPISTLAPVGEAPAVSGDAVIASADVEPAQVVELGFTISALVKEIHVTKGDSVKAGDVMMTLSVPELEYAVIAAEADYKARSQAAELQKADKVLYVDPNTGVKRWYSLPREVYLKALSKADQSKAVWDTALANLAQATLTAPFDGTVVDIQVIPGELVQVNQVVITIASLDHLQIITTDLSERDIARVQAGQDVNIYIEALDETITGDVLRISPIAENVGGDVVFPVTIDLDGQPDGLLWGMSAEVEIQTE
ncbi:MAG: efflux RND transporter periplasmic adaptor subunit [Anaerolineales bacterium]|nr:efflux RND transporter periplasmic adaptor subunit [Anaerolineales bacterium]